MSNETDLSLSLEVNEHQHVMTGQLVRYARVSTIDQNLDAQVGGHNRDLQGKDQWARHVSVHSSKRCSAIYAQGRSADRHEHGQAGAVFS